VARFLLTLGGLSFTLQASRSEAADIYSSIGPNGVERWSTQPLNASDRWAFAVTNNAALSTPVALSNLIVRRGQPQTHAAQLAQRRKAVYPLIEQTARRFDVDVALVMGLVEIESGFDSKAISPKGARGLMQLMPTTARLYGVRDVQELHQPARNLEVGVRHLKDLLAAHDNQPALALASYNAGQGAVNRHGQRIPRFPETMLYVPAVLAKAAQFSPEIAPTVYAAIAKAL